MHLNAGDGDKSGKEALGLHPTIKPVALIEDALIDCSRRNDIALDVFLGSGSTLIAAEKTGRICYGIELAPRYVDVAITRWQDWTGKDAVHAETGLTYNNDKTTSNQ
ncbi:MAG TPA: DNA methyltransferase, partial [Luteolibacter sp.]